MIIKISNDLKGQELWANGTELATIMGRDREGDKRILTYAQDQKMHVHTFKNPVLMTDNYRIGKLPPALRDTLFSLYSCRPRITEYDGVSTYWDDSHLHVWCPSIDTFLFAKALKKVLADSQFETAAEIGCGSGFLSKYILAKGKGIKSILINDLNPYAIKCAMDNIKDPRASFYAGDGLKKIEGQKFDLLICNPPYVPRPNSIHDNPYEGIGMLNHLLHEGDKYLNRNGAIILNISSLCMDIVLSKKPKMKMKILEKMAVPLKVNNILNNKEWVKYLEEKGLKKKLRRGYEYWQTLYIVMLENHKP